MQISPSSQSLQPSTAKPFCVGQSVNSWEVSVWEGLRSLGGGDGEVSVSGREGTLGMGGLGGV